VPIEALLLRSPADSHFFKASAAASPRNHAGFNGNKSGWLNGDVDGNGVIDFDDYSLIDQAFNTQGAALRPEPSAPPKFGRARVA